MTARDRIVLIVVGILATLAAFWFLAISPKRHDAADLNTQIGAAQTRLSTAQASASSAEAAKAKYTSDYATVARLGKAVPVDDDMPSLVYQLEQTAKANKIDFRSIKLVGSSGAATAAATPTTGSSSTPAATVAAALPPGATVGSAGFPTMPFTFDFTGSFFDLQRFLKSLDGLTAVNGKSISVKGRLLTVDGVALKAGPKGFPQIDASVVVTSYLLPADEGLAPNGATATAPSTATSGTTATASLIGSDK
ncbi:type 4a pilus biogenesis protein PilO [Baekduia sp. Peel2402]|uniref:type 4a pilus biogenesis protein PilO n=1 Tax=Baekduia sp. Peel2402 TaxID=3458296 RepID=UPI00403EC971